MKLNRWEHWLKRTGPHAKADVILCGITHGVNIDFEGDRSLARFGKNLRLTEPAHEAKVTAVIEADVAAGKKAGPFDEMPCEHFVVSPIGAVPKKFSEKIRVIHHLSFPFHGDSVNAGTVDEYLPLSSFDHAADAVRRLGRGCFLIKLDVEAAYKQVPVRREDWHLLGFMWRGKYYYERVLPFGLKSSCRLWDLYAEALHQMLKREFNIDVIIHYIDDFLFVCKTRSAADAALASALGLCEDLGIPMASGKTEGPTHCLTFLGIELDTQRMRARLPDAKLTELKALAEVWVEKSSCTGAELQSLVGSLSFACKVVRPGRFYLRRLITHMALVLRVTTSRTRAHHTLPAAAIEDVRWWLQWVEHWNGISLLYDVEWTRADKLELFTDACLIGYGVLCGSRWYAGRWDEKQRAAAVRQSRESMPFFELYALVSAAVTFGADWQGRKILFHCDCLPVVQAIAKQSSPDPQMMHLLRTLAHTACTFGFDFRSQHIAGVQNIAADILSRHGDCQAFRVACPNADPRPTPPLPLPLLPPTLSPRQ